MKMRERYFQLDHVQTLRFHIFSKLFSLRIGHCSHWFLNVSEKEPSNSAPMNIVKRFFFDVSNFGVHTVFRNHFVSRRLLPGF